LSNDAIVTDDVMSKIIAFLFQGHTLNIIKVAIVTIQAYMAVVNTHYRENNFHPPFDHESSSKAARLLKAQSKVQKYPDRQEPLLTKATDPLEYRAAIWDVTVFASKSTQWTPRQTQNTM